MNPASTPAPISVQLYTLREQTATDFPAVLARLGAKGYPGVELAGFGNLTPDQLTRALADAGLTVSSAHVGVGDDLDEFAAALDAHQALGCDTVVIPALPPDTFANADGVAAAADRINGAHALTQARGITLGYHNHFWEIPALPDGRPALVHLFEQVAPDVIAEVDIYWAQVGGVDPAELVATLGDRVGLLHVKDGPADEPKNPMVAVGDGVVDIPGVLAAAPSARWHIVELDRCATDMFDAVERSYDYLVENGLSSGADRRPGR
jgi:sugar phosphate isomerase/epimerase